MLNQEFSPIPSNLYTSRKHFSAKILRSRRMGTEEAFCLKWNDFQESISSSLGSLLSCSELHDVTLQCGPHSADSLHCHRLVLAACSDWFRNIFKSMVSTTTRHPVIVLWDATSQDMRLLLEFMYHGQVNVKQEHLNSFLSLAEKLSVRGLSHNDQNSQQKSQIRKLPTLSHSHTEEATSQFTSVGRVKTQASARDVQEMAVVKEEEPREGEEVQFDEGYDYYPVDPTLAMQYEGPNTSNIVNSKGERLLVLECQV